MVTRADRVIIRPDKTDARSKIAQAPSEHRPIDFPQIAVNRMHAGNGRAFRSLTARGGGFVLESATTGGAGGMRKAP